MTWVSQGQDRWRGCAINQSQLEGLAHSLAPCLLQGDVITLCADLGAGKTTFARALVRALCRDPALVVPSPTFTIAQTYSCAGLSIHHLDLYRLGDPEELVEIGFDDMQATGVMVIEWPENAGDYLPKSPIRLEIALAEENQKRNVTLTVPKNVGARLAVHLPPFMEPMAKCV